MITLTALKTRVLQVLEDPSAKRYDDNTLEESVRQALGQLEQRLPNLVSATFSIISTGRDQPLTELNDCMYLVSVCLNPSDVRRELEPESGFSYQFQEGVPVLHFSGRSFPKSGDALLVTYAARHSLSGLDGAEKTTIPDPCVNALVNGAAGQACLLRAGLLAEAYGTRPAETARLLELSRIYTDRFEQNLAQLKILQEFGFPPGFALDANDKATGRE